jgi:hypothetical protein
MTEEGQTDPRFALMLVSRDLDVAKEAVTAGVDRLFIDLEVTGKAERQHGRSTVISGHTLEDLARVRAAAPDVELLARINPASSALRDEVDAVVVRGADVVMLPFFTSSDEVARFVEAVAGRARVCLLLETAAAVVRLDPILRVPGIDEIHVGLNDLHASLGLGFMYEILAGGVLDGISERIRRQAPRVRFGFGGGALIDARHPVSPRDVLREHVRLGSEMIILSRTFMSDPPVPAGRPGHIDLAVEVRKIRDAVAEARQRSTDETERDQVRIRETIWQTAARLRSQR